MGERRIWPRNPAGDTVVTAGPDGIRNPGAEVFDRVEVIGAMSERAVPVLPGDDVAVARRFYVEGLGFGVRFEASEDGKEGLVGFERGGICVTVDCPMPGHGREACVSFEVDDADAYYEEWRERVDILRAPKNEAWGARTFDLLDPFGNTVFVIGPLRSAVGVATG